MRLLFVIPKMLFAQINSGSESPLQAQERGTNMISCSAYDSITYNGHTINQINATDVNNAGVQSLWGSYTSVNNDSDREKLFMFGSVKVAFNTEFSRLTNIEIPTNQWPVNILGKEVRVGDHFNDLKQKFGNDLKIIYKPAISPNYVVTFNCSGNDYDGILIDLSTTTNKIIEIIYFVNP
ncbi:hypothetical protein [Gracilimonas sp.]|uniref:hypothetical protein n=1 Tax=Gracilimonas sp. TaxID=1974203 RepID=UPI0032EC39EE